MANYSRKVVSLHMLIAERNDSFMEKLKKIRHITAIFYKQIIV